MPSFSAEAIMEQIKAIKEDTAEIKAELSEHVKDQNRFMVDDAKRQSTTEQRVSNAHERIDALSKSTVEISAQVKTNEQQIARLAFQARIVSWVASALGLSLIALIVSIITGQATIIFK